MSLKKTLTKFGLLEEDINAVKASPLPQTTATQLNAPSALTAPVVGSAPITVDPDISAMIEQSLNENKLAGFDYLKFVSAIEEMKTTGTPEEARYKMAFLTAKQLGVNKPALLDSGQHYLKVLQQDESDFNANCDQRNKNEIQSREAKIAKIDTTISDLTKQLIQLQQDQTTLKNELQEEKVKLETKRTAFQLTLQNFRATIESNIQKINQYLQ